MGAIKSLFNGPKLPKPADPAPLPQDANADAIGQAAVEARRAARRRLGALGTVYTGNAATGVTGTPRTASGGLTGS